MLQSEPPRSAGDLNFVLFGIPVRIHPMFWLVTALLGINATHQGEPMLMLVWVAAVLVSILVHELGHAFAARSFGWQPWITLHGFGGLAAYQPTYRSPLKQILISLAGPAAGFALAGFLVALLLATGHQVVVRYRWPFDLAWDVEGLTNWRIVALVHYLLFINVMWGLVNLLPIYPLDGGQISREALMLTYPKEALKVSLWLSVLMGVAVAVYGLTHDDYYLGLFFGYLAFTSYQMLEGYFGRGGGFGGRW